MKFIVACAFVFATTLAEPPVDNRYLPPHQGVAPGQIYSAPTSVGAFRRTDALIRNRPTYAPSRPAFRRPSAQYIPPRSPSPVYGTPASTPLSQYGVPQFTTTQGLPPSSQYGAPQTAFQRQLLTPSAAYGTPGIGGGVNTALQNRQYLPPGVGAYSGDQSSNEPANYSFEYMVKDDQSGNDFGHRESRLGDRAEGIYYVVLPDGRKQTVEYEADQDGYKPRVSYQDTGLGVTRYGQAGGYTQGY